MPNFAAMRFPQNLGNQDVFLLRVVKTIIISYGSLTFEATLERKRARRLTFACITTHTLCTITRNSNRIFWCSLYGISTCRRIKFGFLGVYSTDIWQGNLIVDFEVQNLICPDLY